MSFLPPDPPRPATTGEIALVGAGPGAADLLTLRALDRLRRADLVFHDRLVDAPVLALTPARCICVGKAPGRHDWPQARIDAEIVAAALAGARVVRLKAGDPCLFGRATEELAAARAAGIPVEIVPGITAATAAAAGMARSLTERGRSERLVLATATCQPGEVAAVAAGLAPGTTLALYMAVHRLEAVEEELLSAGMPAASEVDFVERASTPDERRLSCRLKGMAAMARAGGIANPAVVLIRWDKRAVCTASRASAPAATGEVPALRAPAAP